MVGNLGRIILSCNGGTFFLGSDRRLGIKSANFKGFTNLRRLETTWNHWDSPYWDNWYFAAFRHSRCQSLWTTITFNTHVHISYMQLLGAIRSCLPPIEKHQPDPNGRSSSTSREPHLSGGFFELQSGLTFFHTSRSHGMKGRYDGFWSHPWNGILILGLKFSYPWNGVLILGKKFFHIWHFDADFGFLLRRVCDIYVGRVRFGEGDDFLPKFCDGEVNDSLPKKKQKEPKSDAK